MSDYSLLKPGASYPLPKSFNYAEYIDIEQELWALFPETDGKRVNFGQIGLTAQVFVEVADTGSALNADETYILMPCPDSRLRPLRMKATRRLTLTEYRMGHLTALKLAGKMAEASEVMQQIGLEILGSEVLNEAQFRLGAGD